MTIEGRVDDLIEWLHNTSLLASPDKSSLAMLRERIIWELVTPIEEELPNVNANQWEAVVAQELQKAGCLETEDLQRAAQIIRQTYTEYARRELATRNKADIEMIIKNRPFWKGAGLNIKVVNGHVEMRKEK